MHVASTFSRVCDSASVKRWESGKKEDTAVTLTDMIANYNSSVGGVDLANMLIALCRTEIVSKK